MIAGETWTGPDGTAYLVVEPGDVREGELRWYLFEGEDEWPRAPSELHDEPSLPSEAVTLALVLPRPAAEPTVAQDGVSSSGQGSGDLDELERLARAATPGPWEIGEDERECAATLRARPTKHGCEPGPAVDVIIPFGRAYSDAAFIAAANPTAVLALIARVRDAERDNLAENFVALEGLHDNAVADLIKMTSERELPSNDFGPACRPRRSS